jgi:hypothetical protein
MFSGKRFDPLLERRLMQNASLHILKHQACGFIDKPLLLGGGPVLRNLLTVESKHRVFDILQDLTGTNLLDGKPVAHDGELTLTPWDVAIVEE